MHLAQVHSPAKEPSSSSSSTAFLLSSKNIFIAFFVGLIFGVVLSSSFFFISPHQFHADVQLSEVDDISSKLLSLPPSQKRIIFQKVFGSKTNNQQQKQPEIGKEVIIPSSSVVNNKNKEQEEIWEKNKAYFPLFEPIPKKPVKIAEFITRSMWTEVDVRLVDQDFGQKKNHEAHHQKKTKLLPWTWVNVRPHINALPALTKDEVLNIWGTNIGEITSSKKMILSARSSLALLASSSSSNTLSSPYFFPVWLQTKYGYRGNSIAVVGGLLDLTDKSLRQTAIRELREELGVVCQEVISHGRFVNDGNRGCGNFESFYARNCKKTDQSNEDRAAKDSESQQLLLFTEEDLIETMKNTRELGKLTEFPYSSESDAYDQKKKDGVQKKYFSDDDDDDDNSKDGEVGKGKSAQNNNKSSMNHGFVLKETKWISTISMTLLALMKL